MIVRKTYGSFGNPLNSNLVEKPVQEENRYLFPSKEIHKGTALGNRERSLRRGPREQFMPI